MKDYTIIQITKNELTRCDIDLCKNSVKDIKRLCHALKYNTSVVCLNLTGRSSYYYAGDMIFRALAHALTFNNTIRYLYVHRCGISDLRTFSEALAQNTSLTSLNMNGTQICEAAMNHLFQGLKHNCEISTLNLLGVGMRAKTMRRLFQEVLPYNGSLVHIDVSYEVMGHVDMSYCANVLRTRKDCLEARDKVYQLMMCKMLSDSLLRDYTVLFQTLQFLLDSYAIVPTCFYKSTLS